MPGNIVGIVGIVVSQQDQALRGDDELRPSSASSATAMGLTRPGASTAHARRRLAKLARLVERWWQSLPETERHAYYSPAELAEHVGAPITSLAAVLELLGWQRGALTLKGKRVSYWAAPGHPPIQLQRGRPADASRDTRGRYT